MEKIGILDFRLNIENEGTKDALNMSLISDILISKSIVPKSFGLCSEPWDKYFEISHTNKRGVSYVANPLNTIYVRLNESNSTRKKRTYFHSIQINLISGYYYFCCLPQSSFFKDAIGPDYIVYKVTEDEIPSVINKIFKQVEWNGS